MLLRRGAYLQEVVVGTGQRTEGVEAHTLHTVALEVGMVKRREEEAEVLCRAGVMVQMVQDRGLCAVALEVRVPEEQEQTQLMALPQVVCQVVDTARH